MIDSKDLCRVTGAALFVAQIVCFVVGIIDGGSPIDYAYGFSLWGGLVSYTFLKSK